MREQFGYHKATGNRYQNSKCPSGVKYLKNRKLVCDHCGEEFMHYASEIYYKHKDKLFCTYKCKRAYLRKIGVIE